MVDVDSNKKIWTLESAKKVFPIIYEITEISYRRVELLKQKLNSLIPENELETIEDQINKEIQFWVLQMLEIGVEVKGLWLIDFDNGKGYYCWKYDEKEIFYEHDYDSGFAGRRIIKKPEDTL